MHKLLIILIIVYFYRTTFLDVDKCFQHVKYFNKAMKVSMVQ